MPSLNAKRPRTTIRQLVKSWAWRGIQRLPWSLRLPILTVWDYRQKFGYYPNILFPKTFNEKIQVRKIFDRRPQLTTWADKYAVRDYVRSKIGEVALPILYHVTTDPCDIPFDRLPKKYVVKSTHASGHVQIIRDGEAVNRQEVISTCKQWLACNYWQLGREWIYKNITPRIIVEEFLDPGNGRVPNDYKFFVFDGQARVIQVSVNRFTDHRKNFYDAAWKRLDFRSGDVESCEIKIAKPRRLATMLEYAQVLAGAIDFVRVDLYEIGDRVLFGELTFTPFSGYKWFYPASWDRRMGDFWNINWRS